MAYATYNFYVDTYKGNSIPSSDFDRLVTRASSYLNRMSGGKVSPLASSEEVKMATCAVAEAWKINEQGGDVVSQSVGPWSKSYQKEIKTDDDRLFEAATLYLSDIIRRVGWC